MASPGLSPAGQSGSSHHSTPSRSGAAPGSSSVASSVPGDGGPDTAGAAPGLSELSAAAQGSRGHRSWTLDCSCPIVTRRRGNRRVEVAHEALLTRWARLAGWIDDDRRWLTQLQHLAARARAWDEGGRSEGELYRGASLEAAIAALDGEGRALSGCRARVRGGRSPKHTTPRRRAAQRSARRLRGLLVGVAIALVVALVAGAVAFVQRRHADSAAAEALSAADAAEHPLGPPRSRRWSAAPSRCGRRSATPPRCSPWRPTAWPTRRAPARRCSGRSPTIKGCSTRTASIGTSVPPASSCPTGRPRSSCSMTGGFGPMTWTRGCSASRGRSPADRVDPYSDPGRHRPTVTSSPSWRGLMTRERHSHVGVFDVASGELVLESGPVGRNRCRRPPSPTDGNGAGRDDSNDESARGCCSTCQPVTCSPRRQGSTSARRPIIRTAGRRSRSSPDGDFIIGGDARHGACA